jgi:hypothetical protein
MSDSDFQKHALQQAREVKEAGRRRIDSSDGLVWAMTKPRSWSEWGFYIEGHPRPRRIGTFHSTNIAVIKALVDALEPLQARGLL